MSRPFLAFRRLPAAFQRLVKPNDAPLLALWGCGMLGLVLALSIGLNQSWHWRSLEPAHLSLFGMVLLGLLTLGRETGRRSQHSLWWLQAMLYWPLWGRLGALPMAQALADPLSLLAHAAPLVVLMARSPWQRWCQISLHLLVTTLIFVVALSLPHVPGVTPEWQMHAWTALLLGMVLGSAVYAWQQQQALLRRRLWKGLQHAEELFQLPEHALVLCTGSWRIRRANQAFCRLVGVTSEQRLRGESLEQWLAPLSGAPGQAVRGSRWHLIQAPQGHGVVLLSASQGASGRRLLQFVGAMSEPVPAEPVSFLPAGANPTATPHPILDRWMAQQQLDQWLQAPLAGVLKQPWVCMLALEIKRIDDASRPLPAGGRQRQLDPVKLRLLDRLPSQVGRVRLAPHQLALVWQDDQPPERSAMLKQLVEALPRQVTEDGFKVSLEWHLALVSHRRDRVEAGPVGAQWLQVSEVTQTWGGHSAQDLIRQVEWTLSHASSHGLMARHVGAHRVFLFDPAQAAVVERERQMHWLLPQALERGEMRLVYQPKVDARGVVRGFEALIRWSSPELGEVGPDRFIPLAERTGFIHQITDWVIEQALAELARWGEGRWRMAINLSALDLVRPELLNVLQAALTRHRIDPRRIELELTESSLAKSLDIVQHQLARLTQRGFQVALDDFGMGYSSLTQLARLPIRILKLDRGFLKEWHTAPAHREVIRSVVELAQRLQLELVVEGTDDLQQVEVLRGWGVDRFQAYLFGKPMPADYWREVLKPAGTPRSVEPRPAGQRGSRFLDWAH